MDTKIQVGIRVRPLIQREIQAKLKPIWKTDDKRIYSGEKVHHFDEVFGADATTSDVYGIFGKSLVANAMQGINGTLFAYGQTASGKTHTIMGDNKEPGILPMAIHDIFQHIVEQPDREFLLRASFIEIYNEELSDLLLPKKDENVKLAIKTNSENEVFIENLTNESVISYETTMQLVKKGISSRKIGTTNLNERSSRSHLIFRLVIESRQIVGDFNTSEADGAVIAAELNIVDLAGSERVGQTGAAGVRFKEAGFINTSLMTLGLVIRKLSESNEKSAHIPYRDSKLTRILQNSLGGNSCTSIVCAVSSVVLDETQQTLQFAARAKEVSTRPSVNEILDDKSMMKKQMNEIRCLKKKIIDLEKGVEESELAQEKNKMQMSYQQKIEEQEERITLLLKQVVCHGRTTFNTQAKLRRQTWCPGLKAKRQFRSPAVVLPSQQMASAITHREKNTKMLRFQEEMELKDDDFSEDEFLKNELQCVQEAFDEYKANTCSPQEYSQLTDKLNDTEFQLEALKNQLHDIQSSTDDSAVVENCTLKEANDSMASELSALKSQNEIQNTKIQQLLTHVAELQEEQENMVGVEFLEQLKQQVKSKSLELEQTSEQRRAENEQLKSQLAEQTSSFESKLLAFEEEKQAMEDSLNFQQQSDENTIRQLREQLQSLADNCQTPSDQIQSKVMSESQTKLTELESKCSELENAKQALEGKLKEQAEISIAMSESQAKLSELESKCSELEIAKQALEGQLKEQAEISIAMSESQAKLSELESKYGELEHTKLTLEGKLKEQSETKLDDAEIRISETQAKLTELETKYSELELANEALEEQLVASLSLQSNLNNEMKSLLLENRELNDQIESVGTAPDLTIVEKLETANRQLRSEIDQMNKLVSEKVGEAEEKEAKTNELIAEVENLKMENLHVKNEKVEMQSEIDSMKSEISQSKNGKEAEKTELLQVVGNIKSENIVITNEREELQKIVESLKNENYKKISVTESKLSEFQSLVKNLRSEQATIEDEKQKALDEIVCLKNEIASLEQQTRETSALTTNDSEVYELSEKLAASENFNSVLKAELQPLREEYSKVETDLAALQVRQVELETEKMLIQQQFELAKVELERLNEQLSKNENFVEEAHQKMDALQRENSQIVQELAVTQAEKQQLKEVELKTADVLSDEDDDRMQVVRDECEDLRQELSLSHEQAEKLKAELVDTKNVLEILKDSQENYDSLENENTELRKQTKTLKSDLNDLTEKLVAIGNLTERCTEFEQTVAVLENGNAALKRDLEIARSEISESNENLSQAQQLKQQVTHLQNGAETLSNENMGLKQALEACRSEIGQLEEALAQKSGDFNADDLEGLRHENNDMQQHLELAQEEIKSLTQELETYTEKIAGLQANVHEITGENDLLKRQCELLKEEKALSENSENETSERAGDEEKGINEKLNSLENEKRILEDDIKQKLGLAEIEKVTLIGKVEELEMQLDSTTVDTEALRGEFAKSENLLNELKENFQAVDTENKQLKLKFEELNNELKEAHRQAAVELSKQHEKAMTELAAKHSLEGQEFNESYCSLKMSLEDVSAQCLELKSELDTEKETKTQLHAKYASLKTEYNQLVDETENERAELMSKYEELRTAHNALTKQHAMESAALQEECEVVRFRCETQLTRARDDAREKEQQVQDLEEELSSTQSKLNDLQTGAEMWHAAKETLNTRIAELKEELKKANEDRAEKEEFEEQKQERQEHHERQQQELQQQHQTEITEWKNEMDKLCRSAEEDSKQKEDELEFMQQALDEVSKQKQAFEEEIEVKKKEAQTLEGEMGELRGELRRLKEELSQVREKCDGEVELAKKAYKRKEEYLGQKHEEMVSLLNDLRAENLHLQQQKGKEIDDLIQDKNMLMEKVQTLNAPNEEDVNRIADLQTDNKKLLEQLSTVQKCLADAQNELIRLHEDNRLLEKANENLKKENEEKIGNVSIRNKEEEVQDENKTSDALQGKIMHLEKKLAKTENDLQVYKDNREENCVELAKLRKKKQEYGDHIKKLCKIIEDMRRPSGNAHTSEWEDMVNKLERAKLNLDDKVEGMEKKIELDGYKLNKCVDENRKFAIQNTRLKKELDEMGEEKKILIEKNGKLTYDVERITEGLKNAFSRMNKAESICKDTQAEAQKIVNEKDAEIKKLEEYLKKVFDRYQYYKNLHLTNQQQQLKTNLVTSASNETNTSINNEKSPAQSSMKEPQIDEEKLEKKSGGTKRKSDGSDEDENRRRCKQNPPKYKGDPGECNQQ